MRRKIRENGELERTRKRKEKELEVHTHGFYFYKISVPYKNSPKLENLFPYKITTKML